MKTLKKIQKKLMMKMMRMMNKDKSHFPIYSNLCPNPTKDKESLPVYWEKLNTNEKQKWLNENMATENLYYDNKQI